MAEYKVTVAWQRDGAVFTDNKYGRGHVWRFDGGIEVPASSSPHVVPIPMSVAEAIDPEEAFVAALSSCHMLWFLSLAAARGLVVDSYRDDPVGVMSKDSDGRLAMTRVTLRPKVDFDGESAAAPDAIAELHHQAHDRCFIANSVRSEIVIAPA